MDDLLSVETGPVFWLLLAAAAVYVTYHFATGRLNVRGRKVAGGLILGTGSVAIGLLVGVPLGLGWNDTLRVLPWAGALAALAVPVVARAAASPGVRATLRPAGPGPWALYLVGYELFFRGLLLLGLEPHIGAGPALGVSTALYVFQHLEKHAIEVFSTLLMGVVFGQLALVSGAIWAPATLHFAIAVAADRGAG